jgi:hypothetical protein
MVLSSASPSHAFYLELLAEAVEAGVDELGSVVVDEASWDPEAVPNIRLTEFDEGSCIYFFRAIWRSSQSLSSCISVLFPRVA